MTGKTISTTIERLDSEMPRAYVFVLQAGNDGGEPLTGAQIETARNAAKSVLEITGATVSATTSVVSLPPIENGRRGRLVVDVRHELIAEDSDTIDVDAQVVEG